MSADYNPTECARLVAEAREQYRCEEKHGYGVRAGTLLSLADQLEAAQSDAAWCRGQWQRAGVDYQQVKADLAAAQRRIAELEACCTEHEIDHAGLMHDLRQAQQLASERATALHTIYPVYRAAEAYVDGMRRVTREAATGERGRLIDRISVARGAITPEILAALERAGLETDNG